MLKPIEKYVIIIFGDCFKLKKTSLECTSQQQQKVKPQHCVLKCSEKVTRYNTFLDATLCIQTKNRKKNTLHITPCFNVILWIQTKNRKQKHNTRLHDRNRKKCKSSLQAQKKSTTKIKILFLFLCEGIYSVCQFLYFYNLPFAFIHYTFCGNSINMGFCWIFNSFNHGTLWITFQSFL